MWILVFSLLFMQQANHTDVRLQEDRYTGFKSEQACSIAGDKLNASHKRIATEETDDYDSSQHDNQRQLDKDRFELMRPFYTCIEVK